MSQSESLDDALVRLEPLIKSTMQKLQHEVDKLGLSAEIAICSYKQAQWQLNRDPASGEDALIGIWKNSRGFVCGSLTFHADGSFFVEHDVIRSHPLKPNWFVEAVTAWGNQQTIRSEAKLLPTP